MFYLNAHKFLLKNLRVNDIHSLSLSSSHKNVRLCSIMFSLTSNVKEFFIFWVMHGDHFFHYLFCFNIFYYYFMFLEGGDGNC